MSVKLVGFVADLSGSEDHLFEAAPAIEIEGRPFVAPGLDWTIDDLVPVQDSATAALHRLPWNAEILPGETVWVGGRNFVERVKHCSAVGDLAYEIGGWQAVTRGYRAYAGNRRAFEELVRNLRNRLERGLNQALFDQMELLRGDAPVLHELYSALPLQPDLEYQLTRALYFYGNRDEYAQEFVRAETVHLHHLIESEEEFDRVFEERRLRLEEPRPGESNNGFLPAMPAVPVEVYWAAIKQINWSATLSSDALNHLFVTKKSEGTAVHLESEPQQ